MAKAPVKKAAPKAEQEIGLVPNPVGAEKQKPTAKPNKFNLAEFTVSEYEHRCEPGDTIEDIQRPEYWCHVAARTSALSRITVINRLKGWEATLRVIETGKGLLKVVLLTHTKWSMLSSETDETARLKALYTIEERPDGYRVLNAHGESVSGGLTSRQVAEELVDNIVKSVVTKAA